MKRETLPTDFQPHKLAKEQRSLAGIMPIKAFKRLEELVEESTAEAAFAIHCSLGTDGQCLLTGRIEATLSLNCQRCLSLMSKVVSHSFLLVAVGSEKEQQRWPEHESILLSDGRLNLLDLLEEELLLQLPLIPKHDSNSPDCLNLSQFQSAPEKTENNNSFSMLKSMLE